MFTWRWAELFIECMEWLFLVLHQKYHTLIAYIFLYPVL